MCRTFLFTFYCMPCSSLSVHKTVVMFVQRTHRMERQSPLQINLYFHKTATTKMAPLISPTCSLPGRPTLNPRLGVPSECPTTHSSLTTLPPCPVIITPGPGRIHKARPLCSPTTPGPGPLESLLALRLCGVSSTWRSLLLRGGCRRLSGRRLRRAEHLGQREREVVGAGAVIYPRSWTSNQVGKENMTLISLGLFFLCTYIPTWILPFTSCMSCNLCLYVYIHTSSSVQLPCREQ